MRSSFSCCVGSSVFFEGMLHTYQWTLDRVIAFKSIMLMVTIGTFFATIALYVVVPKGFFPTEDTGYIIGITEGATDISFPGDFATSAQGCRDRAGGSCGSICEFYRRYRRTKLGRQQRTHVDRAEATQRARQSADDPRAPATDRKRRAGSGDLFPADPEHQSGWQTRQKPISVHAAIQ